MYQRKIGPSHPFLSKAGSRVFADEGDAAVEFVSFTLLGDHRYHKLAFRTAHQLMKWEGGRPLERYIHRTVKPHCLPCICILLPT